MNVRLGRNYRTVRRDNPTYGAATALAVARRMDPPPWAANLAYNARTETWEGEVNGMQVTIRATVDQDADISFLGTFTDDPTDAIGNPEYERGRFRYFRPDYDNMPTLADLRRHHSRTQARVVFAEMCREMAVAALAPQFFIEIEIDNGHGIGRAVIGGVFIDNLNDALWAVDDHGLITEAIDDITRTHDHAA